MNKRVFIAGVIVLTIVITCFAVALPVAQPKQASGATVAFDHSNCQYPNRWSNPVDGCDNSDPAAPECIKSFSTQEGEQACIAALIKQHEQPAAEPAPITQPVPAPTVITCGGK